ncbi:MAG: hypothetical protein QOJ51_2269 [Acidobacteriaceae bacterium]|nr:hypothetical protein [Acidobacteriaceae bacterium]
MKQRGNLLHGESTEIVQLDNACLPGVGARQPPEGFIQQQHLISTCGRQYKTFIQIDPLQPAASNFGVVGPCMVHQYAPHYLRSHPNEVFPILPVHFPAGKPEIGFVDQCSCLKSMVWTFPPHVGPCQSMQLMVDERKQAPFSRGISRTHGLQQYGHLSIFTRHGGALAFEAQLPVPDWVRP